MSRFTQKPDYFTQAPDSENPIVPGGLNMPRKLDIYYIDINCNYLKDLKGLIIYDEDVVKVEVANILATPLRSDHFEPTFGSNIPYRLQDPISDKTSWLLTNDSIEALTFWLEERGVIRLQKNLCYVRPALNMPDMEAYEIKMVYTILKNSVVATFNSFLIR